MTVTGPPSILLVALVSAIGGLVFLSNTVVGNNWLTDSILAPPSASQGLLPIANAVGKDLMLDVSPQLHPSTVVGESAKQIKFQHWIDNDIHCEDCLRLEVPNNGKKAGAAFSAEGAVYNFEEAKKMSFYVMGEEAGAKVSFKAVGNDKGSNAGGNPNGNKPGAGGGSKNNSSSNNKDLFTNQEFAITSQNVTLNQTWNYLEMNLEGAQQKLGKVKYPFGLEVSQGKGNAVTVVYLKGISYSSEPVQQEFLLGPSSANTTTTSLATTSAQATALPLNVTLQDNATEPVNVPATVEFNTEVSNGQKPYSFNWDFKDGNATETKTDGSIVHTFTTPGLFNVTVDVRDSANNTGSAATLVDVVENETIDEQPAAEPTDNSTQDSQPALGTQNSNDNITSPVGDINDNGIEAEEGPVVEEGNGGSGNRSTDVTEEDEELPDQSGTDVNTDDDGSANDTEAYSSNTGTGPDTESVSTLSNSPPIANAGEDIIGHANEHIILDASKSSDPDEGDTIVSYLWEQESGPTAEIDDETSPTPVVTLPAVDEDSTIVFSLTVNDGTVDSEEQDTVSIFVDYADPLTDDIEQSVLKPSDITTSQWTPSGGCEGDTQCLSDGSQATFVAAGTQSTNNVNLYSFHEFSVGGTVADSNSLVIERVVAEIYAKKLGNTGFVSFAAGGSSEEEPYFTPSISIGSNSFQKYYQVWDTNPVTGKAWTYDSLNSLVAGFKYDAGQSGVQISELQLVVSYHLLRPETTEPVTETGPALSNEPGTDEQTNDSGQAADGQDEEQEQVNETDGNDVDNNGDTAQEEGDEEAPTGEPDSNDSGVADVNNNEDEESSDESDE